MSRNAYVRFAAVAFVGLLTVWARPLSAAEPAVAAEPKSEAEQKGVPYKTGADLDPYEAERCKLDLYLPEKREQFATLVWFHGGGLTAGDKGEVFTQKIARALASEGIAVAAVNYRLSPKVSYPAYIEDAAASTAFVHQQIAARGGNPSRVFVGGHSAGGYLTLMLALDDRYLKQAGVEPAAIAGYFPVAGQTVTHSTVRKERGLSREVIVVDEAAPLRWVKQQTPLLVLIVADQDMAMRVEENELLQAALASAGNKQSSLHIIAGRNHGTVASEIATPDDPARKLILARMRGGE